MAKVRTAPAAAKSGEWRWAMPAMHGHAKSVDCVAQQFLFIETEDIVRTHVDDAD